MKEFELEPGEHVVRVARKHWFLVVLQMLPFVVLAALPYLLPEILRFAPPLAAYGERIDYADPLQRAALGAWLLLVWTGAWGAFTRYYLNAWVLTSERLVTIKQRSFFNRSVASLLIERVQDVTIDVRGLIPSLLGYGNIKVQSAGADIEFTMRNIPRPEQMRDLILRYVDRETEHQKV